MPKESLAEQQPRPQAELDDCPPIEEALGPGKSHGMAATYTRNAAISLGRLIVTSLVALLLPAYLTHKLPVKTYSAWVLILQLSAYVSYLDFGVQTAVSKYIAEYEATGDTNGANLRASAGFCITLMTSILGVLMTLILAWRVPQIFHEMPSSLYRDVRISLVLIGSSLSFGLLCSVFAAIFIGLHRYAVPMVLSIINRIIFTAVVSVAVFFHSSLAVIGALVAIVNIATGFLQIAAWRKLASRIQVRLQGLDYGTLKEMLGYCSALAIWSAGMLCVSGLDVTIVGRYDFSQTGFYSIATLPNTFMIAIMGAALAPFIPTTSALNTQRSPREMGSLLSRTTRYSTILLLLSGLPLLVGGYWILRVWVGPNYALQCIGYLRILVLANIVRTLCAPYATMLVATNSQRVAIGGAIAEAVVNVMGSIYLARHIGAIGVAYGTLLGAFISVSTHFVLNMHYTYRKFSVSRAQLFWTGVLRPAAIALPSILLLRLWWSSAAPWFGLRTWLIWAASTLLIAWFVGLNAGERRRLVGLAQSRFRLSPRYS